MSKDELTRRVAATLERGSQDLDPAVERGLARARARALERAERAPAWRRLLVPAGSLAAAAAAVLLALSLGRGPVAGPGSVPQTVAQAPADLETGAPPGPGGPWTRQQGETGKTTADATGTTAATAALNADGDLDLLAASENLDLYEDLDFFAWLAEAGNGQS